MLKLNVLIAAGLVSLSATAALADQNHAQHGSAASAASTAPATSGTAAGAMTAGEIRKVDTDQGKVTLKHEAIANLDMPPMTMVFRVAQADMLKNLKPGDKVQFQAQSDNGALVVTRIETQK
jgi:Cu(I)/Ag(I) efflux system periplasmic protein CusF